MRALFVLDPLDSLDPSLDSSVGLMHAAQDLGCEVWAAETSSLEALEGRAWAHARQVALARSYPSRGCSWTVPNPWYEAGPTAHLSIDDMAAVFLRVEPPLDADYLAATYILDLVDQGRTSLVNDPAGLRAVCEHLVGLALPDLLPPTVVTASSTTIRVFLAEHHRVVLKPVDGFAGRGVFLLREGDPNVGSLLDSATAHGARAVVVQAYLPEVADGSKRIFLLDGAIVGAVLRHPTPGDFRIGNPDKAAEVTARDHEIVSRLRALLQRHGLRCVGLDVIGRYLIEVNVTCPGAMRKADALLGTALCTDLVKHVLSTTGPWRDS